MILTVNNLKRWITSPKLAEHVYQLKSKVSKYLCKLSDQDLRLDQVKNMAGKLIGYFQNKKNEKF